MKNRIGIGVTLIVALILMLTVAFAGGIVLAPYLTLQAQALATPPATALPQPTVPLSAAETDLIATYEQALTKIYRSALPAVVNIRVTQKVARPSDNQFNFPFPPFGPPSAESPGPRTPQEFYNRGQGSGFVWDKEGHIITNYHVVADATDVEVVFASGNTAKADVLGTDPNADLAVIKVNLPEGDLQPLTLADNEDLQVGQLVVAIGNPFGQEFTMTSGIISAVGRTIRSGNSPFSIPEVIQTDAAINPGNSGGPLLNRRGQVIGLNTMILSNNGVNSGVGFAVPIKIAKKIVPTLIKGESFEYAWLGLSGTTLTREIIDLMKLPAHSKGALVIDVTKNSPADKAGLQGSAKTLTVAGVEYQLGGDVITAINDQSVNDMDDLITYLLEKTKPGDKVTLKVLHPNGKQETMNVTLDVRPSAEKLDQGIK